MTFDMSLKNRSSLAEDFVSFLLPVFFPIVAKFTRQVSLKQSNQYFLIQFFSFQYFTRLNFIKSHSLYNNISQPNWLLGLGFQWFDMQTLQSSFSSVYSNYYNFFKFFPRELGLIVRDITSDGCAAKDGRLQVSNFSVTFFNSPLFLYYPLPFSRPQVHRLFFSFCCFTPFFAFFPTLERGPRLMQQP